MKDRALFIFAWILEDAKASRISKAWIQVRVLATESKSRD